MKDATKQVIALGGGGFSSSDTDDSALDRYILEQATVSNPAVCFVGKPVRPERLAAWLLIPRLRVLVTEKSTSFLKADSVRVGDGNGCDPPGG